MGAQGNTGPAGPAGSGLIVKDANGNELGTLISPPNGSVSLTIYKSGYAINVNIDGTFTPQQIFWSNGAGCSGTPYLNDGGSGGIPTYSQTVIWSAADNAFLVTSGTATKAIVTSVIAGTSDYSFEYSGNADGSYECDIHQNYDGATFTSRTYSGWTLSTFDPQTTLGWPEFSTCTVVVQAPYNDQTQSYGSASTKNVSCLAGPLQLP